ncbi:MAG: ABC transporter ATP-binding protein [Candidatus Eremiobacteraeota bacterium]|nr:ABC transporter ATP-binding protein [Candidatus Eremiobacteraeota bacterium]
MSGATCAAIEVQGVAKSFPTRYSLTSFLKVFGKREERAEVLHDVNLEVRTGEIFGLLGPNGAGKTTLLKILATLLLPDRGSVRIAGVDAVARPLEVKRRVGFALTGRSFYYRLSGRANLELFGTLCDLEGARLRQRIHEVVEIVDLGWAIDRPAMGYSAGMVQRLAIARALLGDPEILILDEPSRAVDPVHAIELRALIRDFAQRLGKTIVMSTNILEEAWSVCDRLAIISSGRLAAIGAPEQLAARFADQRRFAISFEHLDRALVDRLRDVVGVTEIEVKPRARGQVVFLTVDLHGRNFTELLAAISSNGSVIQGIREVDDALFDAFRATTETHVGA